MKDIFSVKKGIIRVPLNVGDTVYVPWVWRYSEDEISMGVACPVVESIQIVRDLDLCGFFINLKSDIYQFNDVYGYWRLFSDLGKYVFLTYDEAERALINM